MPGRFLFFLSGGAEGGGADGEGPEEETLASAEPELEAVMAEEFSTSIGMVHASKSSHHRRKLLSIFLSNSDSKLTRI